jgi:hypothetical protein
MASPENVVLPLGRKVLVAPLSVIIDEASKLQERETAFAGPDPVTFVFAVFQIRKKGNSDFIHAVCERHNFLHILLVH